MRIKLYELFSKFNILEEELINALRTLILDEDFILGKAVSDVETLISNYTGHKYGVGVANGTDALILSLRRLKQRLPRNRNKIITTPLSYLATTSSIILEGFIPVFCDIDASLNIDASKIQDNIDEDVAAIQLVHYSGIPADLLRIRRIAEEHNINIIEDCAQAFGAKYQGEHVGRRGAFATLSFHPLKLLSCMGDGGMILTNDVSDYEWLKKARNHGHLGRNDSEFPSINSRLDSIHARTILLGFDHAVQEVRTRQAQVLMLKKSINNSCITFPSYDENSLPSYNWLVLLVERRNEFIRYLDDAGIESKIHYPLLIPEMTFTQGLNIDWSQLQNAKHYASRIVSVPIGSHLNNDDIDYMINIINSFGL